MNWRKRAHQRITNTYWIIFKEHQRSSGKDKPTLLPRCPT